MHRMQIYLHDTLHDSLKRRAQIDGISMSELIRRTLEQDIECDPLLNARTFFLASGTAAELCADDGRILCALPAGPQQAAEGGRATMMPARLVVDKDIVIHLLKKQPATVAGFAELVASETIVLVSPIVVAAIYAGAFESEHKDIEGFFKLCPRIDIDHDTARVAGLYAKQYDKTFQGISLEDYLLAAAANAHRCPHWAGNRKYYPDDIDLFDA